MWVSTVDGDCKAVQQFMFWYTVALFARIRWADSYMEAFLILQQMRDFSWWQPAQTGRFQESGRCSITEMCQVHLLNHETER